MGIKMVRTVNFLLSDRIPEKTVTYEIHLTHMLTIYFINTGKFNEC